MEISFPHGIIRKGGWSFGIDYSGKRLDVTFWRFYAGIDWSRG